MALAPMLPYPTSRASVFSQIFLAVLDPVRSDFPELSAQVGVRILLNAAQAPSKAQPLSVTGSLSSKIKDAWAHSQAKVMPESSTGPGTPVSKLISIHVFLI